MNYYTYIGPELIRRELGIHNWVDDRGGKTAHGVTERLAAKFGITTDDVTIEVALSIFKEEFYEKKSLSEMPNIEIAWRLTIDGLHSGATSICMRMQEMMNLYVNGALEVDGMPGVKTLKELDSILNYLEGLYILKGLSRRVARDAAVTDFCSQLKAMQYAHYRNICIADKSQVKWWKGWLNRIRFEPHWYRADVLNLHRHLMN